MLTVALAILTVFKNNTRGKDDTVPERENKSFLRASTSKGGPVRFTDQNRVTRPPRTAKKGWENREQSHWLRQAMNETEVLLAMGGEGGRAGIEKTLLVTLWTDLVP